MSAFELRTLEKLPADEMLTFGIMLQHDKDPQFTSSR